MMEIAAAMSMASSAYKAIKAAVETGREAQDLAQVFGRFFDAKEVMSEATAKAETSSMTGKLFAGKSVEAEALQATAAKFKVRQLEKELYEFLLYTGQADFYEEMMKERREIRIRRANMARKAAEKKAFIIDMFAIGFFCVFVVSLGFGMFSLISKAGGG